MGGSRSGSRNGKVRSTKTSTKPATSKPAKARAPAKPAARRTTSNGRDSTTKKIATKRSTSNGKASKAAVQKPAPIDSKGQGNGKSSGKYVYCIIETKESPSFGRIGIGAELAEVHTVNYKDIAAVVSDTPIEVYDPTRENVLAHERVNETVMRDHTVIPMSFGTVFKTREDIVELLRSAYNAFRDVLEKMQNKLEVGLKVLWDPEAIIREVEKEDENLRRLREEISTRRSSTYFARMQYGRLADSLLQERSETYAREIFSALREVAVASRANKPIGDRMILNAAFLVSRDGEATFDRKLKEVASRLPQLTFKYTGPWPPYNFVNIRLKLERAKEA